MSDRFVLAVPSVGRGGLDGERSAHFGHCDCFTLVDVLDGEIEEVRIVENPPHDGCLQPVRLLASEGVDALIAAGMGARPLAGFDSAGIAVYYESVTPGIGDSVRLVLAGAVETMGAHHVCGGDHGECG